ncbi:hypothetical protein ACIBOZ_32460 [Streptomyces anulatus]
MNVSQEQGSLGAFGYRTVTSGRADHLLTACRTPTDHLLTACRTPTDRLPNAR